MIESRHQTNNQCTPMKVVSLTIVKMEAIIIPSQAHCSRNSNLSHIGIKYSSKRRLSRFKATRVPKIRLRKRSLPRHICRAPSSHPREDLHQVILFSSQSTHRPAAPRCLVITSTDSQVSLLKKSRQ